VIVAEICRISERILHDQIVNPVLQRTGPRWNAFHAGRVWRNNADCRRTRPRFLQLRNTSSETSGALQLRCPRRRHQAGYIKRFHKRCCYSTNSYPFPSVRICGKNLSVTARSTFLFLLPLNNLQPKIPSRRSPLRHNPSRRSFMSKRKATQPAASRWNRRYPQAA